MKALLIALLLVAPVQAQQAVTFAWDANPASDNVQGYLLSVDGTVTDVGPVTMATQTVAAGAHVATVVAYNAVGGSPASVPLSFTIPAQTDPCAGNSLTVIVASYTTPLAPGSESGLVMAQAKGPNPVIQLQVKLDAQVIGEITGRELRFVRGIGFGVPRTLGTYHLFVAAKDATGCAVSTTLSRPLVIQ